MTESPSDAGRDEMEIERIYTAFEEVIRQGNSGLDRLSDFASKVPAQLRPQCLRSLVAMDLEYRWKTNEILLPRDYVACFPADEAIVREAFDGAPPPTTCQQLLAVMDHSGLLTSAQIQDFFELLPPDERPADACALAQRLVDAGKLTSFQSTALLSGERFKLVRDDYVIESLIGHGGMGDVYQALQRSMSRRVAYKVIKDNEDDALRERFHREVSISGMLESDHIVRAYHTGEFRGTCYLVMALVDGGDLATLVHQRGPMPGVAAVECLKQIAAGLDHAHRQGIIHRDIKPGNILWDAQRQCAAIADWGLARGLDDAQLGDGRPAPQEVRQPLAHSALGGFVGTRSFAPREQLQGGQCDRRSDIYALGKTLYCLVAGATTPSEAEHLTFGGGDYVSGLDEIYRDMVADDPEDRYQTMADLRKDLRQLQPTDAVGLANMRYWMATAPRLPAQAPTVVSQRETFTYRTPTETFIKKVATPELSRRVAQERLRAVLADAERWQHPDDAV